MDPFLLSRLVSSIPRSISRMGLDLSERFVITECATGAYACTPVIAGLAGAKKVLAFGKDGPFGTFENAKVDVTLLWHALELPQNCLVVTDSVEVLHNHLSHADIVTNSGHLRPLNADLISKMKKGCVIPLMYESWEFRRSDLDLEACKKHGIPVAGTNERHPAIGVFEFLGPIVAKSLFNADLEIMGNNIILICDNDFRPYIEGTLRNLGANVLTGAEGPDDDIDAIIFAHTPARSGGKTDIRSMELPKDVPMCLQLWGDVDRQHFNTRWVPEVEPRAGYMGIKLSSLGVEAVVRLQTGGLKVGQLIGKSWKDSFTTQTVPDFKEWTGLVQII